MTETTIDLTPHIDATCEMLRQLGARLQQRPESDRQSVRELTALARQATRIAAKADRAGAPMSAGRMRGFADQCTALAAEVRQRAHLQVVPR